MTRLAENQFVKRTFRNLDDHDDGNGKVKTVIGLMSKK